MKQLSRNEAVIQLLKEFKIDPLQPKSDFLTVYAYALVEYGVDGKEPVLELLRLKQLQRLFRRALDQDQPGILLIEGEALIDQFLEEGVFSEYTSALGITEFGIDIKREFLSFIAFFVKVAHKTRSPQEVLRDHKIQNLQQELASLRQALMRLPTLEGIRTEIARLPESLQGQLSASEEEQCRALSLSQQMRGWFETLGYEFEDYQVWEQDYFEWIISYKVTRRKFSRVVVRGIDGEIGLPELEALRESVKASQAHEGWLVTDRRVSSAVRGALDDAGNEDLSCFTFDELLDEDADFTGYLNWLEQEIKDRGIDQYYVPLGCVKDEINPETQQKMGSSEYEDIDRYVKQWLDDPAQEHLSILGEFGTGKTWFAFHYAWEALKEYQQKKEEGTARPRLPLVIPLRDYAKAVSVESLFSEFFFRKHEIPLPGYSAFEQLNRMGKLLLIFDGFDEMAARIDSQKMIDNFWELARVVVPGSKAILTCRTEHFPEAQQGRKTLAGKLKASTAKLTGQPPQFETLELKKFNDDQIRQVLSSKASPVTVELVMGNPQLLDLARRPVMTDLVMDALPDIEQGKSVDLARVYLYAIRQKMERDIAAERTFTSLADKLYFLCELSWDMITSDQMSLNYRQFPERLRTLFGSRLEQEQELDHWRYDMMGQALLTRNADGDYSPAHRSLLEFFVAYKLIANLGVMHPDFVAVAQAQSHLDSAQPPQNYTWQDYFRREMGDDDNPVPIASLEDFSLASLDAIWEILAKSPLAKAVLDLAVPMLNAHHRESLIHLIQQTRTAPDSAGYEGTNLVTLITQKNRFGLDYCDLSQTQLPEVNFSGVSLRGVNFQGANLESCIFSKLLGQVRTVTFSPNGKWLAVAEGNNRIQLWELPSCRQVWISDQHQDAVNQLTFSPDGSQLASGSDDTTVKLWDIQTGECLNTLEGFSKCVLSVAFSPDGSQLAFGSDDAIVKLWDIRTGECLNTLEGSSKRVLSVAFSPDGSQLASGGDGAAVNVWDIQTGECLNTLEVFANRVLSVAFSPDGSQLASGSDGAAVNVWNIQTGECLNTLKGHMVGVLSVAFSPDGSQFAFGSDDGTIEIWDIRLGKCLNTLKGHIASVWSVAFSPDGTLLVSGGNDVTVRFWEIQSGDCLNIFQGYSNREWSLAFSPDGTLLASGGNDATVRLWDIQSKECINILQGHKNGVLSVAFSPDGTLLASGGFDATVKVWDVQSGECLHTLGQVASVWSVAFSPDGTRLASGSHDTTVKLWDIESEECLHTLKGHSSWVYSVAFSPDGSRLVSGNTDATVKLWDVESGECLHTLEDHSTWVWSVAFSPDGSWFALGCSDATVKLCDTKSGRYLHILEAHAPWVLSVAFSPDGSRLASGGSDATVKVWDTQSGECLHTLEGHVTGVWSVAFSPDSFRLASGSDAMVKVWDIESYQCSQVLNHQLYSGAMFLETQGLSKAQRLTLKALGAET